MFYLILTFGIGCARTEGYYKMSAHEKSRYKYHHAKAHAIQMATAAPATKQGKNVLKTIFFTLTNF